jgi:predicted flap endonuclease-1-like 5' DNA nuclease
MNFNIFDIFNQQMQKGQEKKQYKKFQPKKIPLENLPGIGRHTPKALAKYGITTINQFAQFEEAEVVALLGKSGAKLLGTAKAYQNHQHLSLA